MSLLESLRSTALIIAASSIALSSAAAQSQDSKFTFRYTKAVLEVGKPDGGTDIPVDPDEGSGDDSEALALSVSLPSTITAGRTYARSLSAVGGASSDYVFSVQNAPHFMNVQPNGDVDFSPSVADVGTYSGIVLSVTDGVDTVSSNPFSVEVRAAAAEAEHVMPDTILLAGVPQNRELLYDGKSGSKSRVRVSNAEVLEYVYAQPLTATGAFIQTTGVRSAVTVEAFVGGEWVEVASSAGSYTGNITSSIAATSDRWRLRRTSAAVGYVYVHDFRPGPSPVHEAPYFVSAPGNIAVRGMSVQIEADQAASAYTSDPLSFSFAAGTAIPSGVSLSSSGVLELAANAAIPPTWNFSVVITDGVGFSASRSFIATQDAPLAATVVARKFSLGGAVVRYQDMYDGYGAAVSVPMVSPGNSLVVDFGYPVRADKAVVGFASGTSVYVRGSIDYESDGSWYELEQISRADSGKDVLFDGTVAAQRWRVSSVNTRTFGLNELRIGGGPVHVPPIFENSSYLASLSGAPADIKLSAVSAQTYGASIDKFEVVSGTLPGGTSLSDDGVLGLPAADEVDLQQRWDFLARVTDSVGFSSDKQFSVFGEARPASEVMATNVTKGGVRADHRFLYDGTGTSYISASTSSPLVLDFGSPVSFSSYYLDTVGATPLLLQVDAGGEWVDVHTSSSASGGRAQNIGQTLVASKIRIVRADTSGIANVREFRLGNGPVHSAPSIGQSGVIANLGETHQEVQLTATYGSVYSNEPLKFELVQGLGAIPLGAWISQDGVMSLPPEEDVDGWNWSFTVRATDGLGFVTEKQLQVTAPNAAAPASRLLPISVKRDGVALNVLDFYDEGTINTGIPSNGIIFDFGRPVSFDRFSINKSGVNEVDVMIENGSDWVSVKTHTTSGPTTVVLGDTYVTTKVKLVRTSSNVNLYDFRLGAGPAYEAPEFVSGAGLAILEETAQSLQLQSAYSTNYVNKLPTFSLISGALPNGGSLGATGLLQLPSYHDGEGVNWTFVARVSDGYAATDKIFHIGTPAVSAGVTLPNSVSGVTGVSVTAAYDSSAANTLFTIPVDGYVNFDFGDTAVAVNSILIRRSDSGQRSFALEVQVGTIWRPVETYERVGLGDQIFSTPGNVPIVGKRFRVKNVWTSSAQMRSLKLGNGDSFPSL